MTDCTFVTLSAHRSSRGVVRYQRCHCGRVRILVERAVLAVP
jgi:hypothetical protein